MNGHMICTGHHVHAVCTTGTLLHFPKNIFLHMLTDVSVQELKRDLSTEALKSILSKKDLAMEQEVC